MFLYGGIRNIMDLQFIIYMCTDICYFIYEQDLNAGIYKRTMVTQSSIQAPEGEEENFPLVPNSGRIINQDHIIKFENVPLVTPNGDVLIRRLSFEVQSGMNVLVTSISPPHNTTLHPSLHTTPIL